MIQHDTLDDAKSQPSLTMSGTGSRGRLRITRWLLNYPRAIPIAIFFAVFAVTALSVYSIESNVRAREDAQMRERAQAIAFELERRGNSYSSYLRAGAALFSSVEEVSPRIFRQFVAELRLNVDYKGAEGIGWLSVERPASLTAPAAVDDDERVQLDDPSAASEAPVEPALPRTYFWPDTPKYREAFGVSSFSDPVRQAAMLQARQTVQPAATQRISLPLGTEPGAYGFVIFMPVYGGDAATRDIDTSLRGYVFSPFNADAFLDAAVESSMPSHLGVRLYDADNDDGQLLATLPATGEPTRGVTQSVSIGNREMRLVVESAEASVLASLSMLTLIFGLAVASLLMLLARLLTRQAQEDQARLEFYEEQHSIRNTLSRELNHRVKNTLANVLSILSLTRRKATDLDRFADSLEGRVRALSATHDLLTGSDWGTTELRAVIEAELKHFRPAAGAAYTLEGPPVDLAPNDALSFGLAIHELGTNAAKFGALSVPEGRVSIKWSKVSDQLAEVEWQEAGGPPVPSERRRGFGTDLIEKIVAHELKQPVLLDFDESGVRCLLRIPVRERGAFQIRSEPKSH